MYLKDAGGVKIREDVLCLPLCYCKKNTKGYTFRKIPVKSKNKENQQAY